MLLSPVWRMETNVGLCSFVSVLILGRKRSAFFFSRVISLHNINNNSERFVARGVMRLEIDAHHINQCGSRM